MSKKEEQVGDKTGQSTENRPIDRDQAGKLANVLEGLDFPADKAKILSFVSQSSNSSDDIRKKLENNLTDNNQYANVYEIEKQAGLVRESR
jgi:hypothetical protein